MARITRAALLREVEIPMPLQGFNDGRQKGDEPFGTVLVGGAPYQVQGLLDIWSIANGMCMWASWP